MKYTIEIDREQHTTFTCEAPSLEEAFSQAWRAMEENKLQDDWYTYDKGVSMIDATEYYREGDDETW